MYIAVLLAIHVLLFWKIYSNPLHLATSEIISETFPTWIWMGRQARKLKGWKHDKLYFLNFHSHPFLSCYYPPHVLTAWISSFLKLDASFRLLVYSTYIHLFIQSLLWFWLISSWANPLIALFGAVSLTYSTYQWRVQPGIVYTLTWFPLMLFSDPILAGIGLGMSLLAGYYPHLIYIIPVAYLSHFLWNHNVWFLWGVLLGLPQIIPFMNYLPKTIRKCKSSTIKVGFWEKKIYVGIIPIFLAFFSTSRIWPLLIISILMYLGLFKKYLPRVHERWGIIVGFCINWMALSGLCNLSLSSGKLIVLICLHILDIWIHNRNLVPTRPFTELWTKPSLVFNTPLTRFLNQDKSDYRVSGLPFPLWTGYINEIRTLGYCGGMANKLMAKFREDKNPNGSGEHDWFISHEDSSKITDYRVKYAYTRKQIGWDKTPIKNLWRNPNVS